MAQDQDYEVEEDVEHEEPQTEEENAEDELSGRSSEEAAEDADAEDDNEREAIRARRREERHAKKANQREREDSLRRELAARDQVINDLQSRVAVVERTNQGSEEAQIDHAINESANAYNHFKQQIANAAAVHDGAGMADATEKMILSQRRYEELNNVKKTYQQSKTKAQPLDARLVSNATAWMEKNKWYDPQGKDADSRQALAIDRELANEGWVPTTPQYWDELQARVNKQLPHKNKREYNNSNRSVVSGSGRESAPSGNGGTYKLSAARVSAMKDAGAWDDPKERAAMIASFKKYDKEQGVR